MTDREPISREAPPLPGPIVAAQRWRDAAFLHWRVDSAMVAPLLPAQTRPDEFDGSSWVGLIAFHLEAASLGPRLRFGALGDFVEVNVRLYAVDAQGRRGVVFVSLEASRLAAVLAARALFGIPYVWSRTRLEVAAGEYRYTSTRHLASHARSRIVARSTGAPVIDDPLADFLTARWALFTRVRRRTIRLRNHHQPWTLFTAELISLDDTLLAVAGFPGLAASRAPDSVLYSPGVTTWFGTRD